MRDLVSDTIDNLFESMEASSQQKPLKAKRKLRTESVTQDSIDSFLDDSINSLYESYKSNETNKSQEIADKVREEPQVVQEEVLTEDVVQQEQPISQKIDMMGDLSNKLSRYLNRTNTVHQEPTPAAIEEVVENLNKQVQDVRRLVLENTIVSGIGQGGDGQLPGSGEVRLNRLDDVDPSKLEDGQTLVWNREEGKWVSQYPGLSDEEINIIINELLENELVTTRTVQLIRKLELQRSIRKFRNIDPVLENLTTQEDANQELIRVLGEIDKHKPTIALDQFETEDQMRNERDIGDLRIDTTENIMYYWNGSDWIPLNAICCDEFQTCFDVDGGEADTVQFEDSINSTNANHNTGDGADGGDAIISGCDSTP
jgi:hypothetical protein